MEHPDWYPDWRHEAVHRLHEKNERLKSEGELGRQAGSASMITKAWA